MPRNQDGGGTSSKSAAPIPGNLAICLALGHLSTYSTMLCYLECYARGAGGPRPLDCSHAPPALFDCGLA